MCNLMLAAWYGDQSWKWKGLCGATGDDTGFSGYYELGLGYRISENFILAIIADTYVDVGKGTELQLLDGSKEEFSGKDVETVGLSLSYMF